MPSELEALLEEYYKRALALIYPCPICHSTEWEHDCPPPHKELRGLQAFIGGAS